MGKGSIGSEDSLAQRRRDAEEGRLESSSSSHPAVSRFTGAHAPDFLSISAALLLCARFLLDECRVCDSRSGALSSDGDRCGVRRGRGSVAPPGVGCSWGDGTQRLRAGLSSAGPPGLGPRLGCRIQRGVESRVCRSVSCCWCPSWRVGNFRTLTRCGGRGCFKPSGVVSVSHVNPGCASRPRASRWNPSGIGGASRRIFIGIDPDPDGDPYAEREAVSIVSIRPDVDGGGTRAAALAARVGIGIGIGIGIDNEEEYGVRSRSRS